MSSVHLQLNTQTDKLAHTHFDLTPCPSPCWHFWTHHSHCSLNKCSYLCSFFSFLLPLPLINLTVPHFPGEIRSLPFIHIIQIPRPISSLKTYPSCILTEKRKGLPKGPVIWSFWYIKWKKKKDRNYNRGKNIDKGFIEQSDTVDLVLLKIECTEFERWCRSLVKDMLTGKHRKDHDRLRQRAVRKDYLFIY